MPAGVEPVGKGEADTWVEDHFRRSRDGYLGHIDGVGRYVQRTRLGCRGSRFAM